MATSNQRPNLICIISDTLRRDYIGCYGNNDIYTPSFDAFAKESVIFNRAYPESLPTIPVRRALHTGRRAYPFRNYKPLNWLGVYQAGWQPMDDHEDTLAENLVDVGYYTGFVSDVPHTFEPGMNFTRGFLQWEFVRGQLKDRWRSPAVAAPEKLAKYGNPDEVKHQGMVLQYLANTANVYSEEDTTTARVFRWAMDFIDDNRHVQPFYLMIDCWDPHEAWEAPASYLGMYAKPGYKGRTILHPRYAPVDEQMTQEELEHTIANYCGLVTLVDTWFGHFIDKLRRLGLWENSVVVFLSDHGTNFADNPERIIGKPHYALYPGLMHVPLMIHLPENEYSGERPNHLVYNTDVTATLYECAGMDISSQVHIDGQSLFSLVKYGKWNEREYLTSRFADTLWYRDKNWWVIIDVSGRPRAVFNLEKDPRCQNNIVTRAADVVKEAWKRILDDAGEDIPVYEKIRQTDALGRILSRKSETI